MFTSNRAQGAAADAPVNACSRKQRCRWSAWLALGCVLVGGGVFSHHFRIGIVSGESMLPNFRPGQWFLLNKRAYAREEPQRGDVVVARVDGELIIKRIVGLPGEEVEINAGHLYINGRVIVEPQQIWPGQLNIARGILGSRKYAIIGDNRRVAATQLLHPVVRREQLLGRVLSNAGSIQPR